MKSLKYIALCVALPTLMNAGVGSSSNVTISLTLAHEIPTLLVRNSDGFATPLAKGGSLTTLNEWSRYSENNKAGSETHEEFFEYGVKAMKYKYSNKEVLTDMLKAGSLPSIGGKPATIAGWSIIYAETELAIYDTIGESNVLNPRMYARHTSKTSVEVPLTLSRTMKSVDEMMGSVGEQKGSEQYKLTEFPDSDKPSVSTMKVVYNRTYATPGHFSLTNLYGFKDSLKNDLLKPNTSITGNGILTSGLTAYTHKASKTAQPEVYFMTFSTRLGSIVGVFDLVRTEVWEDEPYEIPYTVLVEGAISGAFPKFQPDIEDFLGLKK